MKNMNTVLIDTADLLIVIAEEMLAGSFKSLPGPYCRTQAMILMAISRGLMDAARPGPRRGRGGQAPSETGGAQHSIPGGNTERT